jgi:hypothetical protein
MKRVRAKGCFARTRYFFNVVVTTFCFTRGAPPDV